MTAFDPKRTLRLLLRVGANDTPTTSMPTQRASWIGLALVREPGSATWRVISVASEGKDCGATQLARVRTCFATGEPAHGETQLDGLLDVVVMDDNIDPGETMKALLELMGHRVRVFHCAIDALADIIEDPPDVAFLDIGLPDVTGISSQGDPGAIGLARALAR